LRETEPVGGAAAGECVEAEAGELRRQAQRMLEPARAGLVGGDLLGARGVTGRSQGYGDRSRPCAIGVQPEAGLPLAMSVPPTLQPAGSAAMQGRRAADGTAWALRIIEWPVPQLGA
jgi:hypothetical protein